MRYAVQGRFYRNNLNPTRIDVHKKCISFSAKMSTIFVQARDPAKLSAEVQNALDEHGRVCYEVNREQASCNFRTKFRASVAL